MILRTCCPFDAPVSPIGGASCGGTAYVDLAGDAYDGAICILPLDEIADGSPDEYVDRSRSHTNGRGGKVLAVGEDLDPTLIPTIDQGLFCLSSQHFDGRQFISLDQDTLEADQPFTASMWCRFETFYKSRTFWSRGFTEGQNQYVISFGHSFLNTLAVTVHTIQTDGPPAELLYFGTTTLTEGLWYHVAIAYDGTSIKLYVDGVLNLTKDIGGDLISCENGCFLAATDFASCLEGNLQEFHLFPEEKPAHYILAEYRSICTSFVEVGPEEPLLYW